MKYKLSVSLDERLVHELDRILSTGRYRNKSHAVEFAVRKLLSQNLAGKKIPQIILEAKNG